MDEADLTKEQQILRAMRKTLGSIVKDTAPRDGMDGPLSSATVENIRMCFGLIATREAELAEALGLARNERPFYTDEEQNAKVLQFTPAGKKPN